MWFLDTRCNIQVNIQLDGQLDGYGGHDGHHAHDGPTRRNSRRRNPGSSGPTPRRHHRHLHPGLLVTDLVSTSITGAPGLVTATTCAHATGSSPVEIAVWRVDGAKLSLVQALVPKGVETHGNTHVLPDRFVVGGNSVTVNYLAYGPEDNTAKPSGTATRTFTWDGTAFHAGALSVQMNSTAQPQPVSTKSLAAAVLQAPHPGIDQLCGGHFIVDKVELTAVAGANTVVAMTTCSRATGSTPDEVAVFRLVGAQVQLISPLVPTGVVHDSTGAYVPDGFDVSGKSINVSFFKYPSSEVHQRFTWTGSAFTASPLG